MGFDIGKVFDPLGLFAEDSTAGVDAAEIQAAALREATAEQRRQFGVTEENIRPFREAGTRALTGVEEATTPEGLDARLARILGSENFQTLTSERERAARGQLAAGGLTRSGTALSEISRIPTDLAFQIENQLAGRGADLATLGANISVGEGTLRQQSASNITGLTAAGGQAQASGILVDAQSQAAQQQQLFTAAATAAAIFFSDPSLKENVEVIGSIQDLTLYRWKWIPEAAGTLIEKCGTTGFMADEVAEKYPRHVSEYGGFMVIDYPALLGELEA